MEHLRPSRSNLRSYLQGACLALAIAPVSVAYADSGPFAGLAGNWSGAGTITLGNGSKERIRCRANYSVGGDGNQLSQSLKCASDSYNFNLSSNVVAAAGQLSGMWNESSRNMSGAIFGTARPGH